MLGKGHRGDYCIEKETHMRTFNNGQIEELSCRVMKTLDRSLDLGRGE